MKPHLGVSLKKPLDIFGLVRRQIAEYDMNLLGPRGSLHQPFQKGNEVLAGVPRRRHPLHLAGLHVQRRCLQRQCSMAIVFEAAPFRATGRQQQHRIEPIQCLNGRLFIQANEPLNARELVPVQALACPAFL